ncbi:MAG: lytic transglycosylase domain-containing protein [Candidatus Peribacteria bacterium]|nr:MAG: lytic transglycosylase domain-containing protein [Candidatus Peribacteria bacterium]
MKKRLLLPILIVVIGIFLVWFFFHDTGKNLFSYPKMPIYFSDEIVPIDDQRHYENKQRFDKEFLLSSERLYQVYLYIKRYPLYIPYIEEELEKYNIPNDFKYLPIAESALKNDVVSTAGAAGIWQFMPETAQRYGLIVDESIDERYNFEKATEAAMQYIQDLYVRFENWTLVAAAYNRGENGLERDMNSQGVDNYYDLYLNEETSSYVFRIVAIKYTFKNYFKYKKKIDSLIGGVYTAPQTQKLTV